VASCAIACGVSCSTHITHDSMQLCPGIGVRLGLAWYPVCKGKFFSIFQVSRHVCNVYAVCIGLNILTTSRCLQFCPVILTDHNDVILKVLQKNAELNKGTHPIRSAVHLLHPVQLKVLQLYLFLSRRLQTFSYKNAWKS